MPVSATVGETISRGFWLPPDKTWTSISSAYARRDCPAQSRMPSESAASWAYSTSGSILFAFCSKTTSTLPLKDPKWTPSMPIRASPSTPNTPTRAKTAFSAPSFMVSPNGNPWPRFPAPQTGCHSSSGKEDTAEPSFPLTPADGAFRRVCSPVDSFYTLAKRWCGGAALVDSVSVATLLAMSLTSAAGNTLMIGMHRISPKRPGAYQINTPDHGARPLKNTPKGYSPTHKTSSLPSLGLPAGDCTRLLRQTTVTSPDYSPKGFQASSCGG